MIPKGMQRTIELQIRGNKLISGARANYFDWDRTAKYFRVQTGYFRWNSKLLMHSGFQFPVALCIYLVLQRYDPEGVGTGLNYASHVLGWVELSTIITVMVLGFRLSLNIPATVYLINQMFLYSNQIQGNLTKPIITLDPLIHQLVWFAEMMFKKPIQFQ